MVQFKTWEDLHKFLQEYAYCSCVNCVGFNGSNDGSLFICMKTLSPVQLKMIQLCVEWENNEHETLQDYEGLGMFKFSEEIGKKIDKLDNVTFEEIERIINEESNK